MENGEIHTRGTPPPRIDVHIHGCSLNTAENGSFISKRLLRSPVFRILMWLLGIRPEDGPEEADRKYRDKLVGYLRASGHIEAGVVFALDGVYDDRGELDRRRTHFYVSNDYVFRLARDYPEILPGASVHPYRRDALAELERCIERGAVALKWLPNTQGFDPASARCLPVYDLLARRGLPLICHTGGEHTLPVIRQDLGYPERLRPALDAGVTVIACHLGTRGWPPGKETFHRFARLAREYPNLYGDTSGIVAPFRTRYLLECIDDPDLLKKLVHGSDYPLRPLSVGCMSKLGLREVLSLEMEGNPIEKDYRIKRNLGLPDAVFRRATRLLRSVGESHSWTTGDRPPRGA
jgi:hypothetical protein